MKLAKLLNPCLAAALLLAPIAHAQVAEESTVSGVRYQEMKAVTFLHFSMRTTLAKMTAPGSDIGQRVEKAMADMGANKIVPLAPSMFIYKGADGKMETEFELMVGWSVPEGTKPFGEYKVESLKPFKCATILFGGPMSDIQRAYGALFADINKSGRKPTGETREIYCYWEGAGSPNNVTLIQAGVE